MKITFVPTKMRTLYYFEYTRKTREIQTDTTGALVPTGLRLPTNSVPIFILTFDMRSVIFLPLSTFRQQF